MRVNEWYEASAERLVDHDPRIQAGQMLHSPGLRVSGRFFVALADEELVLKPAERVRELVAARAAGSLPRAVE